MNARTGVWASVVAALPLTAGTPATASSVELKPQVWVGGRVVYGRDSGFGFRAEVSPSITSTLLPSPIASGFLYGELTTRGRAHAAVGAKGGLVVPAGVDCTGFAPLPSLQALVGTRFAGPNKGPIRGLEAGLVGLVGAIEQAPEVNPVWDGHSPRKGELVSSAGVVWPILMPCVDGRPVCTADGWRLATTELATGVAPGPEAAHWLKRAAVEHSSAINFIGIASLLKRAGAPPVLVELTTQAAVEEFDHTRFCLLAAARIARTAVQSRMPLVAGTTAAPRDQALQWLAVESLSDGHVGERMAAERARSRAGTARLKWVSDIERRIAQDELGHADLGLELARWAMANLSMDQRMTVRAQVDLRLGNT